MEFSEKQKEKMKLEFKTSEMLFEMFKQDFDKEAYLDEIWSWASWIKTMKDCRVYHAHIMFRMLQKEILESKKWEIAHCQIYKYLQDVFENDYPEIDQETGRIVHKNKEEQTHQSTIKNNEDFSKSIPSEAL